MYDGRLRCRLGWVHGLGLAAVRTLMMKAVSNAPSPKNIAFENGLSSHAI